MDVSVRHQPGFAVARISLDGSESVRAEAGALMATIPAVNVEAKAQGGIMKSLKRAALGGESFFITSYTAPAQGGWVDVAAFLPGDISVVDVTPGTAWFVQKGSWLAGASTIDLDTKWGGFKNLFGSEGGFILRAEGQGPMVLSAYGAIEAWDLEAGQTVTLDTGHMVAYSEGMTMEIRKVTGGLVQTFKSGEGLVFDFTGPGRLLIQTRNPNEFLGFIAAAVGTGNSGSSSGSGPDLLGGLLGRD
ncbi:MAG: TIGR00266 family protein [Actinomycetia bacterium]|nr:TIGR00266 family protein [Actinomycetes bacterium]MCP4222277.1 TIGR00266 family protein [Actinomycetes bacterium]MCP5035842.1 TIGR00266 family protein [Actinomycetes bacterium]